MRNKYINKLLLSTILGSSLAFSFVMGQNAFAVTHDNDILEIGNAGIPKTLDPQVINGIWDRAVALNVFLGLTTFDAKGQTIPGLATHWEMKNGGKTFIFHLRKNLKWSDGQPLTADDVVYSYRHLMDPKVGSKVASIMYLVKNGKEVNSGKKPLTALGVKKIDKLTIQFDLVNPTPFFVGLQTDPAASIIPKHVVEKYGNQWSRDSHIVSNGPYKIVKSKGFRVITLVKNDNFFDAKNVKINKVVFNSQEDSNALAKRFLTGELDWVDQFDTANYNLYNKKKPNSAIIAPYQGVEYLAFNTLKKPYDQLELRQALSMAINRKALIKSVLKGNTPAYSYVPHGLYGMPRSNNAYWSTWSMSKRRNTAKKIMAKLGYSKNHPLEINISYNTSSERRKVLVVVSSFWKRLGVNVKLLNTDVATHYTNMEHKNFEMGRGGWINSEPYNFLILLDNKLGGVNNYSSYNNPIYNNFMNLASKEVNIKKRGDYFYKAEGQLMKDMPIIPLYFYVSTNLKAKKLHGYYSNDADIHPARYLHF